MKNLLILFYFVCLSFLLVGQSTDTPTKEKYFGFSLNSSIIGTINSTSITPSGLFYFNKHQIELGFAIHPFKPSDYIPNTPRAYGTELNYKFFPQGLNNRLNLYLGMNLTYTNSPSYHDNRNYPPYEIEYVKVNYLSLTGGSGVQLKFLKNAYIGTSLNLGVYTSGNVTNDHRQHSYSLFDDFEIDGAIRFDIGYRF